MSQHLEEIRVWFTPIWSRDSDGPDELPRTVIPRAALIAQDNLLQLKELSLHCYVRLDPLDFATLVQRTPQLEHFRSDLDLVNIRHNSCLSGLRPNDMPLIGRWRRLRTCRLTLDVREANLISPPSKNKFVKLSDPDFVPNVVNRWKVELKMLELMDVSCHLIVDDKYTFRLYPLVFATKCDCGAIHYHIDAESAAAESLGFLKPDETEEPPDETEEPDATDKPDEPHLSDDPERLGCFSCNRFFLNLWSRK